MNVWDGKTAKCLNGLSNIVLLNLLWILFCIPVVTIVPATVAMVGVVKKWNIDKEERVLQPFYCLFRKQLRSSILIGFPWLLIGAFLFFDLFLFFSIQHDLVRMALITVTSLVTLFYLFTSVYLVPVVLQDEVLTLDSIKRAFVLSLYDLPISISVLLITASAIILTFYFPITIICIGVLAAMINYRFCKKTFEKVNLRVVIVQK